MIRSLLAQFSKHELAAITYKGVSRKHKYYYCALATVHPSDHAARTRGTHEKGSVNRIRFRVPRRKRFVIVCLRSRWWQRWHTGGSLWSPRRTKKSFSTPPMHRRRLRKLYALSCTYARAGVCVTYSTLVFCVRSFLWNPCSSFDSTFHVDGTYAFR